MALQARLTITGRVQGVGYRDWAMATGQRLGLTGWVRNRLDGSVEAMVQGTPGNVEAIITRAHRGPPKAEVKSVTVSEGNGEYTTFETLPTV